jgi:hypothetical protein
MNNSDNKKPASASRRRLLKSVAAGGGVATTLTALPQSWTRPVVDAVLVPAHAQTSIGCNPSDLVEQILPGGMSVTLITTATTVEGPIQVARAGNTFSGQGAIASPLCPGEPGTFFIADFSGTIVPNVSATANITAYLVCGGVTVCTLTAVLSGDYVSGADPDATYDLGGDFSGSCCPGYSLNP